MNIADNFLKFRSKIREINFFIINNINLKNVNNYKFLILFSVWLKIKALNIRRTIFKEIKANQKL